MQDKLRNILIIAILQVILNLLDAVLHWRAFVLLLAVFILGTTCYYVIPFVLGAAGLANIRKWWKGIRRLMNKRSAIRYAVGVLWLLTVLFVLVLCFRKPEIRLFIIRTLDGTPTPTFVPTPTATPPPPTPRPTMTPTWTPPPTPTVTPEPTPTPIFHVIQEGENPWCLSMAYYHTGALWGVICKANLQFSSPEDCAENLRVGDELWIPLKSDFPQSPIPNPLPVPWVRGKDYICEPEEGKDLQAPLTSQ